jgi:2-polyprenyl-3-methyl-5-hydroxy-6-metoxy-1,4-benzoquinol methylase
MMSSSLAQRPRTLPAEKLDELPADHPDARSSRRDLLWFNAALGNWLWIERRLPKYIRSGERILEIGAGTGEFGARMSERGFAWNAVDRAPRPANWPTGADWHQQDILEFDQWQAYPVVVGNLIFHHFDEGQLRQLGEKLNRHARVIVVGDLRRGRLQQWLFLALAYAVRANAVSRHDGWVSVRAGFRRDELPRFLGLDPAVWAWRAEFSQICAYRMILWRRA